MTPPIATNGPTPREIEVTKTLVAELERMRVFETDEESKLREVHRHRKVNVSDVRSEMDPWLDHTNWAHHLAGFEKEELRASLNAAPKADADDRGTEVIEEE